MYMYVCIYTYDRFPRPASTKNTKVNNLCVRIEKEHTLSIEKT